MKSERYKVIAGGLLLMAGSALATAAAAQGAHAMPMDAGEGGMETGTVQGGSPPADARDPHAYSDGYGFGEQGRPHFADEQRFASLLANRLEFYRQEGADTAVYDLQFWYGYDYDRLVIKAEGDVSDGRLEEATTELFWSHAVAPFWDLQLGLRHDGGEAPDQGWLAVGIQGLAPYWFEVDATAYLGEGGQSAVGVELEYELLFTQRLILQPRIELNAYGREDRDRGIGSGLSDVSAGLRLRYEIRREFAPYIGVEHYRRFGGTRDMAEAAGLDATDDRLVAGVRFWF